MEEALEKARKAWKSTHPRYTDAITALAWIDEDGKLAGTYWNGYCHAAMSSTYYIEGTFPGKLKSLFSGIQKNKTTLQKEHDEMERTFVEWLLFHSPFKKAFLTDTAAGALEHRVLMGDVEQPNNLMGAGLMSTRIFNEHPSALRMWWEFVKRGLHPSIAFVFAHKVYVDTRDKVNTWAPTHTGCFNSHINNSGILNFLRGDAKQLNPPYIEKTSGATESFKLWTHVNKDAGGLPPLTEIGKLLKKAVSGPVSSTKNPFAKAKVEYEAAPAPKLDDAMELLIPHLNKYKEFF